MVSESRVLERLEGGFEIRRITHGPEGYQLDRPVEVRLPGDMSRGEEDVYDYIIRSLLNDTPRLIPFACESRAIFDLAKYLRRGLSSSEHTLRTYVHGVAQFCRWAGRAPDELICECKTSDGLPDQKKLAEHAKLLDDYVGSLQADGLAPLTIANYVKAIKSLYRANGLELRLLYRLKRTIKNEDRAPTPEELQRMIDLGNLRDKAIVSMLALGGFRIGTLARLKYRHVRGDLERGMVPVQVHVEADITKGKYHSYDTFLGKEAAEYLKAYLDLRRRGTLREHRTSSGHILRVGIPPEQITDESPLIRADRDIKVRSVTPRVIYHVINSLYRRAGLVSRRGSGRTRYQLWAHSIRKYFRTQLAALGMPTDYIEYMMGHRISTYHDIRMKGIEFLRNVYASSGLSIRSKTKITRLQILEQMVSAWGMDPNKVVVKEAFAEPHRVFVSPYDREENQMKVLSNALKEMMRKELGSVGRRN